MRLILLMIACALVACAQIPNEKTPEREINSVSAIALMRQRDVYWLDVRSPDERLTGNMPEAMHIRFGPLRWTERPVSREDIAVFLADVGGKFPDKSAVLIVFCNVGIRSHAAVQALVQDGYGHVMSVRQGFLGNRFGEGLEAHLLLRH